jgi:iron complex transport system ATP-binding protein
MNSLEVFDASVPGRLAGATLSLPQGKVIGLVGPNGAGKSTLLQVAAGLVPAAGRVLWNGRPLSTLSALERARCAAWMPQEAHFEFGFSVRTVVAQGRYAHGDDEAGVDEAIARLDLASLADRPVNRLSGGERARVLLARSLATAAPMQLWDEPLAALDPRHRLDILSISRELARNGSTVFFSLHDLAIAASLDVIAVMHERRLRALGAPGEILTPELLLDVFAVRARVAPGMTLEIP